MMYLGNEQGSCANRRKRARRPAGDGAPGQPRWGNRVPTLNVKVSKHRGLCPEISQCCPPVHLFYCEASSSVLSGRRCSMNVSRIMNKLIKNVSMCIKSFTHRNLCLGPFAVILQNHISVCLVPWIWKGCLKELLNSEPLFSQIISQCSIGTAIQHFWFPVLMKSTYFKRHIGALIPY